jgi:host factor-I protein
MGFRGSSNDAASRQGKSPPPEDTRQEAAYLKMLGEKQRPVRIKLMDGDVVRGWIEYYDRRMVRLTREGAPNLFIFKHEIAYIAEDDAARKPSPDRPSPAENGNSARGSE